ncbi:MAG: SDR family oxidoreductase, partial [Gammaproteobacteria bacterium]
RLRQTLGEDAVEIRLYTANPLDFDSCSGLVAAVERDLGPVDIIINALDFDDPVRFRDMDRAQWGKSLSNNLDSVFNICRQVVEGMGSRGFGRIVNIASVISRQGEAGHSHYAAAKAGVHGFTMSLAQELARNGVTVNTVSPGYLDKHLPQMLTEEERQALIARIPAARLGSVDEIACLVDFLCSDQAGYITGADIAINGGQYMH